MRENFSSNNFKSDEFYLDSEESDYKSLITRLKEIKKTIGLLEKKMFR